MSKLLSVVNPHRLGTREAVQRINAGIPLFQSRFGRSVTLEQTSWSGNTLAFTIRTIGIRTTGTIVVLEDSVKLEADLPLLLVPFAGTAESLIKKHGAKLLAGRAAHGSLEPAPLRSEIQRRAKAAATAAGNDWRQLSKDERKRFRQQARRDIRQAEPGRKHKAK